MEKKHTFVGFLCSYFILDYFHCLKYYDDRNKMVVINSWLFSDFTCFCFYRNATSPLLLGRMLMTLDLYGTVQDVLRIWRKW